MSGVGSVIQQQIATGRRDSLIIWPIVLACTFPLILVMLWTGPFELAFFGIPFLFSVWILSALITFGIAISSANARLWRQTLSLASLPLVTLVAIVNADRVWPFAIETGERIHFQVMRRSYLEDVAKLPLSGQPRFAIWRWGGFVIGHGVVYDESDEIMSSNPSSAWKSRVANTEVGMCGAWGEPLGNHFYLVRTGC